MGREARSAIVRARDRGDSEPAALTAKQPGRRLESGVVGRVATDLDTSASA